MLFIYCIFAGRIEVANLFAGVLERRMKTEPVVVMMRDTSCHHPPSEDDLLDQLKAKRGYMRPLTAGSGHRTPSGKWAIYIYIYECYI